MFRRVRNQKGAALVEYSLLVAGIALVGAAAVSVFGHKTTDLMAAVAAVLPGAHADDNAPIISGKIIETTNKAPGEGKNGIGLDIATISGSLGGTSGRLGNVLGSSGDFAALVIEAGEGPPTTPKK